MTRLLSVCLGIVLLVPAAFAQGLPPAPMKVVRYADIIIQRYDRNGDGILQREEWEKMPGTPKQIDLDGDDQITNDELVWYFRHYGQTRTIHRTIMLDLSEPPRFDPANMSIFRPVWQSPVVPPAVPAAAAVLESTEDVTEALIRANEDTVDDEVYQRMLEERQVPSARPYHVLQENLQGVPRWFIQRDKNGDGQISLAEFAPTLSLEAVALFQRLDKNGDGFIEPDEARASQTTP